MSTGRAKVEPASMPSFYLGLCWPQAPGARRCFDRVARKRNSRDSSARSHCAPTSFLLLFLRWLRIRCSVWLLLIWLLIRRGLLIRILGRLLILLISLGNLFPFIQNSYIRSKPLVIFILHNFANVNVAHVEVQGVVGPCVGGKPVPVIDLLPPGGELGIKVFLFALFLGVANLRHGLPVGLNDLEVVIVYPNAALKVSLLSHNLLGRNIEDIAMQ